VTKYFTFESKSKPGQKHVAQQFDDGGVFCPCTGFKWRNRCWHTDAIRDGSAIPDLGDAVEPVEGGDTSFDVGSLEEFP
jgi:hypothetical protein